MQTIPIPFPLIEKMDDRSIVACLLRNVSDVTGQFLYGKCGNYFLFLYRYFKSDPNCDNAVELANDAYLNVMTPRESDNTTKLQRFDFSRKLYPWFCKCSRNMCIDRYRKHKKIKFYSIDALDFQIKDGSQSSLPLDDESLDDDSHVIVTFNAKVVEDVLNHMSHQLYAEILRHRFLENMSPQETADIMGITYAQCTKKTDLAKAQFRKVLRHRYPTVFNERDKKE